ncbi:MAG: hypothetical protein RMN25_09525, partial [Anaerolineae bacterium]|nr:hypothetical protein [Thermoflexales bacterium]MDW8408010.1 hypothetical protein [Anaerolineae bacterium]
MKRRKGIYQSFDASGAIVSDERWQLYLPDYPAADGALWQIEAEITRIDPFPEPRVESLSAQLI